MEQNRLFGFYICSVFPFFVMILKGKKMCVEFKCHNISILCSEMFVVLKIVIIFLLYFQKYITFAEK